LSDSKVVVGFVVDSGDSDTSDVFCVSFIVVTSCAVFNFVLDTVGGVSVAAFVASGIVDVVAESVCIDVVVGNAVVLVLEIKIGALGDSLCGALVLGITAYQCLHAACKTLCSIGFVITLLAVLYVDFHNSASIFVFLLAFSWDDVGVSVFSVKGRVLLVDGFPNILSNCYLIWLIVCILVYSFFILHQLY
jgi:hypothetical protein